MTKKQLSGGWIFWPIFSLGMPHMRIMRMRIMRIAKKWRMAIPIVNWLRLLAFFLLLLDFHWLSCFLLTSTAFKWISSVFLRISMYFYCLSTDFIQTFHWLLLTLYWLRNNLCWILLSHQNKANWISIDDLTIFLNKQTNKQKQYLLEYSCHRSLVKTF